MIYPTAKVSMVAGVVVRDGTTEVLQGVIVEVFILHGDKALRISKTDQSGRFRFDLRPGAYILQFSFVGYDRVRQPIELTSSAPKTIEVGLPLGT